ncbi:uncharacterized protein A4U43_C01F35850 [Asparagus officinalis]|uniref:Pentacotripeptide-repeat region of PRORP domain-containing protein n=1 Tax=Asparagus officinalis TaxID=4686 RepID=A0A5P1FVH3_ASPOF|nr:pentatricopeptide repeat-containing protein At5g65560-like [Asparagus officinalis]XP_020247288.1 pentatricopeptide repeat-containing protein At5g65560-like [Asparagus officinalis]ONK82074.1 uncharacterized protein A4U43_C01F35850 [Asparagus officinalis]
MPCHQPRQLNRTLESLSNAGDHFSKLCSAAASHRRPPPTSALNKTLKSLSRSGNADELLDLAAKSPNLSSKVFFLNTLINAFIVSKCRHKARAAFAHLKQTGVTLTNPSYSIILKLQFLFETDSESPYSIMGAMVKCGCKPDAITYSTLISGLCRVGRIEEAWGFVDKMEEENCPPTVRCYTSIVFGYCNFGRIDDAKCLIDRMGSFGCSPDTVTYTILIDAMCKRGGFDEVRRVLEESELNGWKPNEITYHVYINGLCKVGEVDEAFRQLDTMRDRGLSPSLETLHRLFDSLSCDLSEENLWKVIELLSWDVDAFFYNTLVGKFCQNGSWLTVLKLLAAMLKKGMLDICTYTVVINSLCKRKMLGEAKYVFCSMDFEADAVAFNTLLMGFNRAREFNEVYLLFDLVGKNITLNEYSYVILIDSLCREKRFQEAVDYIFQSIRKGFLPNLITRPVSWLVKDGKPTEILNLFEEMLGRGLVLDVGVFNSLIRALCKKGLCRSVDSDKFYLIFDIMLGIRQSLSTLDHEDELTGGKIARKASDKV